MPNPTVVALTAENERSRARRANCADRDTNGRSGSCKVGSHDDLVTALRLAVHDGPRPLAVAVGGRRDRLSERPIEEIRRGSGVR